MTGCIAPFPRPPAWVFTGRRYRIYLRQSGPFVAACTETHGSWATFRVLEDAPEIAGRVYSVGELVDVPREGSRVEELA